MCDNDDIDIIVQCWAEVQRRHIAIPRNKMGKQEKVLKPRGSDMWKVTEKMSKLVSVERTTTQIQSKMRRIIDTYKDIK